MAFVLIALSVTVLYTHIRCAHSHTHTTAIFSSITSVEENRHGHDRPISSISSP